MAFNENRDFARLRDGLPAELERLRLAGEFERAVSLIDRMLDEGVQPTLAPVLRAERARMLRTPMEYCVTRENVLEGIRAEVPEFSEEDLERLIERRRIDWRFVNGEQRFLRGFLRSLRLYAQEVPGLAASENPDRAERAELLDGMRERGGASRLITLRASISAKEAVTPEQRVRAWLPIPAACAQQSQIEILDATAAAMVAPEDAPQRTISWSVRGCSRFEVSYRFRVDVPYRASQDIRCEGLQPTFDLGEEEPHIVFTPYLRLLAARITGGLTSPLEKARSIYDWVTQNVDYRFQPPYLLLDCIPDNVAKSLRADCGLFALLFVTLCRISGIPARWQSGLVVRPSHVGCHDWAQFYIEPEGWLWADCSFGSSARREGDEGRREFYFGNVDPWRMVANSAFFAPFAPEDEELREDPFDNQLGEMSVDGRGLDRYGMDRTVELVEMREA